MRQGGVPGGPSNGQAVKRAGGWAPCLRAFLWVQAPLALTWYTGGLGDFPIFPYTPAPSELAPRLEAIPKRVLSAEEREAFKRDGVLFVPGVLGDEEILAHFKEFELDWRRSHAGTMLALIRDGPLGALAASALGVKEVRVIEANIWNQPMNLPFGLGSVGNWHQDFMEDEDGRLLPVVSTWLSLSEDARALEFAYGSHKRLAKNFCSSYHPWQLYRLPDECVRQAYNTTKVLVFGLGDAVVFQGQVLHQGLNEGEPRSAIAIRWVAARAQYSRRVYQSNGLIEYTRYLPQECGPFSGRVFPIAYPSQVAAGDWPVVPTLQDMLGLLKSIEDYEWGRHRSLPRCNATWDDGTDL